jgi:hypothetical protein
MKRVLLATIFAALTGTFLQAQTSMKANIPFEFRAGNQVLPAGAYVIQNNPSWMLIRSAENPKTALILLTHPAVPEGSGEGAHITFNRYGNTCFLHSVWSGISRSGYLVPRTRAEREIAKNLKGGAENTSLVASRE